MSKELQSVFEKNLSKIVSDSKPNVVMAEIIDVEEGDSEQPSESSLSRKKVSIRNFEDFVDGMDGILKRRLHDSDKFHHNVEEIRKAMDDGKLIINIVAPGYNEHKELVDLIINQALTSPMSSEYDIVLPGAGENMNDEQRQVARAKEIDLKNEREKAQERRYDEMNKSVVIDTSVGTIIKAAEKPENREALVDEICESSFVGGEMFDPEDPVNCLYAYVEDYYRDPIVALPDGVVMTPNERRQIMRYDPTHGRTSSVFRFADDSGETTPFTFDQTVNAGLPLHKHNLRFKDPNAAPIAKSALTQSGLLPAGWDKPRAIYFDERAESSHYRRNPRYEESYKYNDTSKEIAVSEIGAINKLNGLIDNGFDEKSVELRNRWFAFCKVLSMLQEAPVISIFNAAGFDKDGNPRENPDTGKVPGIPTVGKDPILTDEIVNEIISGFLNSIGVENEGIAKEITHAIVDTAAKEQVTSQKNGLLKKNAPELSKLEREEVINILSNKILDLGHPKNDITVDGFVKSWVEEKYKNLSPLGERVEQLVKKRIAAQAFSKDGLKKEALIRSVEESSLLQKIQQIIASHKNVGYRVLAGSGPEYIVDLLIKYIYKSINNPEEDFSVDPQGKPKSKKSVLGVNKAEELQGYLIIPFDKVQREALGIVADEGHEKPELNKTEEQVFEEKIKPGTQLRVTSKDSSEVVTVENAYICDINSDQKSFPSEAEEKASKDATVAYVTGLYVELTPSTHLQNAYLKKGYTVSIVGGDRGMGTAGLSDKLYGYLYGKNAKAKKESHKKAHVELNLSIYPSWSPSEFDYRKITTHMVKEDGVDIESKGLAHPNNVYNVKLALEERLHLKEILLRKSSPKIFNRGPQEKLEYGYALRVLDQEIAEIRYFLYNYALHKYSAHKTTSDVKDTSKTLLRGYGDQNQRAVYRETAYRCSLAGFEIGRYNDLTDERTVEKVLNPEKYKEFLKIKNQVNKDFGNRRSVAIFRDVDSNLKSTGDNNGFMMKDSESSNQFTPKFYESVLVVSRLLQEKKSHIILISEREIPDIVGKNAVISIQSSTISKKEIELMVDYYVGLIKREEESKGEKDPARVGDISKFGIFQTMISRMQKKLSGLPFEEICLFIQKAVKELFESYMMNNDLSVTFRTHERQVNDKMDDTRYAWEDNARSLLPEGSEISQARFKLLDYAVKFKSTWADWITSHLESKAAIIERFTAKINFFRRALETDSLFGEYYTQNDERNKKDKRCYVRFVFHENPPMGTELVWFNSNGRDFLNAKPDRSALKLAKEAGFVISENVSGIILREKDKKIKGGEEFKSSLQNKDYLAHEYKLHIMDAKVDDEGIEVTDSLPKYKRDLIASIDRLQKTVEDQKKSFPSIIMLEGEPGTGKSIFAEVLATVLDCKFIKTGFARMGMSGRSFLRGVAENNFTDFINICRISEDTVILIDEIDMFLSGANKELNSDTAKALLEGLLRSWNDDLGLFKGNNFHIVLTTNHLEVIEAVSTALTGRVKSSGGIHKVELPGDSKSLVHLFSHGSMYDNLMMDFLVGHERLIDTVKELIPLYDSQDPDDIRLKNVIIARLKNQCPDIFTRTQIRPSVARSQWLFLKGLTPSEEEGQISEIDDFVEGWKLTKELVSCIGSKVTDVVEGKEVAFNPLTIICDEFSEKMIYKSTSISINGKPKEYASTTLREFIAILKEMFKEHHDFMAGVKGSLPFNWKTLLAVAEGSKYKCQATVSELTEDGASEEEILTISRDRTRRGYDHLKTFANKTAGGKKIPREFWMTEEQYQEECVRKMRYIAASDFEDVEEKDGKKKGDKGFAYISNIAIKSLYLQEPAFESAVKEMSDFVSKEKANLTISAQEIETFFVTFNRQREKAKETLNKSIPHVNKLVELVGPQGSLRGIEWRYSRFLVESKKEVDAFFNTKGEKYKSTYLAFSDKLSDIVKVVSLSDDFHSPSGGKDFRAKWAKISDEAGQVFATAQEEADELFTDWFMKDGKLTRARYERLNKPKEEKEIVPLEEDPEFLNNQEGFKIEPEDAELPPLPEKPAVEETVPETETPPEVPPIAPVTVPPPIPAAPTAAPTPVPVTLPPDPEKKVKLPAKKPVLPPSGGALDEAASTTDYYYKFAKQFLDAEKQKIEEKKIAQKRVFDKSKVEKKAFVMQPELQPQDPCASLLLKSKIGRLIEIFDNEDRFRAEVEKGIHSEKRSSDLDIWKFY